MPIRSLRDLLPLVLPHVPGCPDPSALQALRLSAREFCERTKCWRHLAEIDLAAGDMAAIVPDHAAIHEIEWATMVVEGATPWPLTPVPYVDAVHGGSRGARAWGITQATADTLMVLPEESKGLLAVSLILKPRIGQDFVRAGFDAGPFADFYDQAPEFLVQQHGEGIAAGALARLMIQPGSAWYAPDLAGVHASIAVERIGRASDTAHRGQTHAQLRVKTVWF